ncbi:AfsR/SARP family transcriptional regulator [Cellulomonas humilata]|uniref:DNA-binding SARP family transcriptional activator n=1 Tax=Cellulomonas humilata TaxID=144055 RepID=A0ABU0EFW0_9CELL|nr:bacterial transcriptional activator domain-containing protein [Cellulomonas humilata]MDQ0373930.1 DNA-binding SARP family transcriptional activator [Cellulomonas humilata]
MEQLVGALAIHRNAGVRREELMEGVWPDRDGDQAGNSLNNLAHWLKQQLCDALGGKSPVHHYGGRYFLALGEDLAVDTMEFDRLGELGSRHSLEGDFETAVRLYDEALQLYVGDLTSGSDILFLLERERLRGRYLSIMATLAERCYALGDYEQSLQHALALVYADPCREDAHRMIMRCYVRNGQRSQALRHFALCRDILHREFGAVPEVATLALFEAVRTNPATV